MRIGWLWRNSVWGTVIFSLAARRSAKVQPRPSGRRRPPGTAIWRMFLLQANLSDPEIRYMR